MKRNKSWGMLTVVVLLAALCVMPTGRAWAAEQTVIIDNMEVKQGDSGSPALQRNSVGQSRAAISTALPNMIYGNNRILELTVFARTGGSARTFVDDAILPQNMSWQVSNDQFCDGNGRIVWSGTSKTTDPFDCSLPQPSGNAWSNFLRLNLFQVTSDQNTNFRATVYSNGGTNSSVASVFVAANTTLPLVTFQKASFAGTVNWDSLCRIEVTFDHAEAIDTSMLEVTAVLFQEEPPVINCVSKTLAQNADYSGKSGSLVLTPPAASFSGPIYAEMTITNSSLGADNVVMVDTLPLGMTYVAGSTTVFSVTPPAPFTLPEPTGGPLGPLTWTSTTVLPANTTVVVRFQTQLAINAGELKTNSFSAKGVSETKIPGTCPASVTLFNSSKVPNLNEWGVIILSLLLAVSAIWLLRKRRVN